MTSPYENPLCKSCFFAAKDFKQPNQFVCHYNPPKPFPLAGAGGYTGIMSIWPVTSPDDFCSHWMDRNTGQVISDD